MTFGKINREKLLNNGFAIDRENFIRREEILNHMTLTIIIDGRGRVTSKIFDADGEPYTLHLVEDATGEFVGSVKAEYERILKNISEQCFDDEVFKSAQTLRLVEYIREKFSDMTLRLDDSLTDEEISSRLEESYRLAKKK